MRVAIVIDAIYRGGAERQALNAAWALAREGCDVELIHYYDDDGVLPAYDHPARSHGRVICIPKAGKPVRFLRRLSTYLKGHRFDVVHAFKTIPTLYASVAGKLAGVSVILGGCRATYEDGTVVRVAHRFANRLLAGWVVNSKAIVESLVSAIGVERDRCFVVYNGVETDAFISGRTPAEAKRSLGLAPGAPVISIVARLRPQKNHPLFLEMAHRVLARHPETRFLVVGDGELRSPLEAISRERGLAGSVLFLGDRPDVTDILAATDVSVLTSHYEGVANALIEAMCAGVPVVTTDYPGADELVTHGREGFVVPRGDAGALAERACILIEDSAMRQRMGEDGRRTAKSRFSVNAMASALMEVYARCLHRAGKGSA